MNKEFSECKYCGFIYITNDCNCQEKEVVDYPLYGVEVL